eukprot:3315752-Amphidinium_carterae.1
MNKTRIISVRAVLLEQHIKTPWEMDLFIQWFGAGHKEGWSNENARHLSNATQTTPDILEKTKSRPTKEKGSIS